MRWKKALKSLLTVLVINIAVLAWLLWPSPSPRTQTAPGIAAAAPPPPASPAPAPIVLPPQIDAAADAEAARDVGRLTRLLRDFRTIAGDNPVGSNAEITAALAGDNPRQAKILPDDLPRNSAGELVDRWGVPYFFHQLSRTSMEIRSAGPDRKMWTSDDVITR